jgi:large subunit ribosomal protein L5
MASKFVVKKTNTGYNFLLYATNGQPIGSSQVYKSLKSAQAGCESVRKASENAPIEDTTAKEVVEEKNPKFVIYNDKAGEFRFRLQAKNGENILASEGYTTLTACKNGCASVMKNAATATIELPEEEEEAPKAEVKEEKAAPKKEAKKEAPKAEAKVEAPKTEKKVEVKKEALKAEEKKEPVKKAPKAKGNGNKVAKESNRVKEKYEAEVKKALMEKFSYKSVMEVPALKKIVINIGVGDAIADAKRLEEAVAELTQITGQKPIITKAKKSIANYKLREGQEIGTKVTLRGIRMYEFYDKLVSIVLPRVRDFRGVNPNAFDGRGNYTLGVKEQSIFPEIEYDKIQKIRGMDVVIVTSAKNDKEAYELLKLLGMPFAR